MYKILNNLVVIFCRLCYNPFESGVSALWLDVGKFNLKGKA